MHGILLIYLYYSAVDGGLGIPQATAAGIVGAYGGGVYLSAVLGAWVADRLFGSERVLFFSAIVIMLGLLGRDQACPEGLPHVDDRDVHSLDRAGFAVSGWLTAWYLTVPETLYFGVLGGIAIVLGLAFACIAKPVLRMMSGVR
jgi:dipeptide/tripeptide permease